MAQWGIMVLLYQIEEQENHFIRIKYGFMDLFGAFGGVMEAFFIFGSFLISGF